MTSATQRTSCGYPDCGCSFDDICAAAPALAARNTVGSGELDAAGLKAGASAIRSMLYPNGFDEAGECYHMSRACLTAYLSALPVDHPEVVGVEVSIKPMRLSDDRCDYFVAFKCGGREVTPHVFRERFKAEYHVAEYRWLFGQGEKPGIMEFSQDDWPVREFTPEEQRAFAALQPSDSPALDAGVAVTEAMVETACATFYGRNWKDPIKLGASMLKEDIRHSMRTALVAALSPTRETGK